MLRVFLQENASSFRRQRLLEDYRLSGVWKVVAEWAVTFGRNEAGIFRANLNNRD
jgi:hypothetical protein